MDGEHMDGISAKPVDEIRSADQLVETITTPPLDGASPPDGHKGETPYGLDTMSEAGGLSESRRRRIPVPTRGFTTLPGLGPYHGPGAC